MPPPASALHAYCIVAPPERLDVPPVTCVENVEPVVDAPEEVRLLMPSEVALQRPGTTYHSPSGPDAVLAGAAITTLPPYKRSGSGRHTGGHLTRGRTVVAHSTPALALCARWGEVLSYLVWWQTTVLLQHFAEIRYSRCSRLGRTVMVCTGGSGRSSVPVLWRSL